MLKALLSYIRLSLSYDVCLISETLLSESDKFHMPNTYWKDEHSKLKLYCGLAVHVKRRIIQQLIPVHSLAALYFLGV